MRILTTFLCLTLAVLLFSAGEAWSLPKCPSNWTFNTWTNCFGTHTFADGTYAGEFRDDKKHGQGTYHHWANDQWHGDTYIGEFRNDKKHGQGTYYHLANNQWKDDKYVGQYRDAKRQGQGTYTYADGRKYVGEFRDAKYHGQGTYTYADGRVEEGIWKDGVLQPLTAKEREKQQANREKEREKQQANREKIEQEQLVEDLVNQAAELLKQQRQEQEMQKKRARQRKERLAEQERQNSREREKVEREKRAKQSRSQICLDFGFKEGSDPHSQCMFDLFKLEQSAAQNLAMQQKLQTMQAEAVAAEERYNRNLRLLEKEIENKEAAQAYQREVQAMRDEAARKAASQNALLEKHQRQFNEQLQAERNFQEGMQMLQYGLGMIDPPRTTTKCQWNAIMQTMTCN